MTEHDDQADAAEPINPEWWATALPPSPPLPLESADSDPLGPPGWQTPEVVSPDLRILAESAQTDSLHQRVLSAMADASSAMLEPEDWAEPFRPFAVLADGRRSVLPSDLDEERLSVLGGAAPLIENVPMRARAADVAWTYGDRSDMELLGVALDSYLATPLEPWAWRAISKDSWERATEVMRRRGKAESTRRHAAVARILDRIMSGSPSDGFMLVDLADLYRRAGNGSNETKRQLADHYVALASRTTNLRLGRHFERTAHRFLISLGAEGEAHAATARIAELYVTDADQRLASEGASEMAAGMDLESAIATLKELPRKYRLAEDIDARIGELRRRLDDTREATLEQMVAVETDAVDISAAVRAAERSVSGRSRFEALVRLATLQPLSDHDQELDDARERLSGGIARLFGRATFAADGRKVASSSGAVGDPDDTETWSEVVRSFGIRVGLVVNARIMPAFDVVTVEHRYDMAFLRRLCWDSPTVPGGHVDLWARGLWHGLNSDFPSAVTMLVPQAEQLLRHHLKQAGSNTLFVDPATGVETEKGFGALLVMDAARDFLGPDLQLELRALFVEQEGANLRNELAHGLLTDLAAWSVSAVYAWWLLLRIAVVPLWISRSETSDTDGAQGSADAPSNQESEG